MRVEYFRPAALFLITPLLMPGGTALAGMEDPPPVQFLGLGFNHATIVHCAIAALGIYLLVILLATNLSREHPRRGQVVIEMLVDTFLSLTKSTIGPNRGRRYLPLIGTLFLGPAT